MEANRENGNCRFCETKMTVYQERCPRCSAKREECFVSKAQQKANIKALRAQIIENIKTSFKERRW